MGTSRPPLKRILLILALLVTGSTIARLFGLSVLRPEFWFEIVREYPVFTPILFVAVYGLSVVFLLPTLPLNLAAGVLWGGVWGGTLALAGGGLGAICAFGLARVFVGQPFAQKFEGAHARWIQEQLDRHGWKVLAFVRLNPIFPGPVNYIFGLTSVRWGTYCWATLVFFVPPTIVFALLGEVFGAAIFQGHVRSLQWTALLTGGAVALLLICIYLFRGRLPEAVPTRAAE